MVVVVVVDLATKLRYVEKPIAYADIYVRRYVHILKTRATRTPAGSKCVCETVPYITSLSLGSEPVLMHQMASAKAKKWT